MSTRSPLSEHAGLDKEVGGVAGELVGCVGAEPAGQVAVQVVPGGDARRRS
jgi:hypothetical protein